MTREPGSALSATGRRGQVAAVHTMDRVYAGRMFEIGFRFVIVAGDALFIAKSAHSMPEALAGERA